MRGSVRLLVLALGLLALHGPAFGQSARYRAMGGAGVAIPDGNEDFNYTNPAGLSQVDRMLFQAGGTATTREEYKSDHLAMTGLVYEAAGDRKVTLEDYLESDYEFRSEPEKVSNWTYGLGLSHEEVGPELNQRRGAGFVNDDSKTLRLSFATRFPVAERLTSRPELYAGARIRYADRDRRHPTLGQHAGAETWSLDVGSFYKATERLTVGSLVKSLLSASHDDTPGARHESTSLDLGAAYVLGERRDTTVALDFRNIFNGSRTTKSEVRAGVERRFLDNDFALRLGSWDGVLTLGFGVKFFEDFRMDYSYTNHAEVREHHVSFRLPFRWQ